MKILVITQAVDTQDTALGFFHRWIEEFALRMEYVDVICLREGEHTLPKNVEVYCLGKKKFQDSRFKIQDSSIGKLRYILNFYKYIWRLRHDYDVVFVHMNQEYILLGGLVWKLLGKKVLFWRNHPHGDWQTSLAVMLSDKVFCTSTHSFTARFAKTTVMPAGIDTEIFVSNEIRDTRSKMRKKSSLLMLGRIAPIKKIEMAIDVLAELKLKGSDATLTVVGNVLPKDIGYLETLKDRADACGVSDRVFFEKGVPFVQVPVMYQSHDIFLNLTPSGSFDKTVVEAIASGMKVLISNTSMRHLVPDESYTTGVVDDMARKIERLVSFDEDDTVRYDNAVAGIVKSQSLNTLMEKLCTYM